MWKQRHLLFFRLFSEMLRQKIKDDIIINKYALLTWYAEPSMMLLVLMVIFLHFFKDLYFKWITKNITLCVTLSSCWFYIWALHQQIVLGERKKSYELVCFFGNRSVFKKIYLHYFLLNWIVSKEMEKKSNQISFSGGNFLNKNVGRTEIFFSFFW